MVRAAKFPHRHSCIIHQVPFCKLPRTNRLAHRGASGPAGAKEKAFDVEVVEIRRRFPWALLATAAGTAGLYAVYLRRQEELRIAEEEAAKLKAEAAATQAKAEAEKSQAEATAKAAALAEAEAAAAREAEAREAAEAEAKLQAEKQAALAATFRQGEQFLNRIRLVENGANYYSASDAHNEDLHELLASVQAFVDQQAFQDLQQAQGDKSELASKLMSSLSFLRLFLERLQTADKCEQQFDSAASLIRAERRRWLAGEAANLALVQDALTRAEASAFELQGLGMESSGFDEVIEMARSNLQEMKDQESKKQLREVAGKALEAAMDSSPFDCKVCEQSAKEARSAGCLPSAALEVAERVAELNEPRSELKNWASEFGRFGLEVSSSASSGTVDAEDFVTAAVSATASMSDKELQDHLSRLAEALAMHHEREKLELSSAWTAMLPEWSRLSQEKIMKIREDFATRKRLGKETMKTELEETASLHLKEALEEAVGEVQERSERDVYDLQSSSMLQLSEDLHKAIRSLDGHLRSLPEFFTSRVQELWNQGRCPQHRVSMTSYSAAATLSVPLGSPLKSGDVAKSDGFVGNVASHLASHLPQGASALSAEELQHAFHRELPELVAAAFEPEHGGILGNLVGKFFGRLYRFRGGQDELSMQEALESKLGTSVPLEEGRDVQKNLRALAEAFKWIELGEFRRALSTLDSLVGQCRARAEDWIHLAREALLLRQASDAVRARSRCLSMSLVE